MSQWQHGMCGCFDNCGICVITYFLPCYTFGKNAEAVGDDCCLCGFAYLTPARICVATSVRGKIRQQMGIDGTTLNDCFAIFLCPLCTLVQEAQEVQSGNYPPNQAMARS